ncbi:methyl-accepting chemotaxis protein [Rhizobium alvei]
MQLFGSKSGSHHKRAVDAITAKVMITDKNLNIIYINEAVRSLLKEVEADLKRELPRFDMATIVGSNIDIFHKNPAHQRGMLASLSKPLKATIKVGGHSFDLVVAPLTSGNRNDGFVVEWANASDRLQNIDYRNQMEAISRVQAIIEFSPEGQVITANDNFLKALGYRLDEITGKHHSMFVDKDYASSPDYQRFWSELNAGRPQIAEFERVGKGGKRVVINASYNPIFDERGKVAKVVKFATDVTERVHAVNEIGRGLIELAAGRLDININQAFAPDFESLRTNFNNAARQLRETLTSVSDSISEIDAGTRNISNSASDLSHRTEQQAASLEETAAALDEITANVTSSSKRTEEAREVATEANRNAIKSAEVAAHAEEAMSRIEASSQQISNIIGVIDEIAFQTNLLALNAGVEAARAGEAGKGFAVVAQEVRELAQRSAQAAKEIKELIRNSSTEVGNGVQLVREVGQALNQIGGFIQQINGHMEAISTSAREQSTGLSEVNSAVNQMDQVTQQNAAMVEETNAAGVTLAGETDKLRTLIDHFSLGNRSAAPARHAPARPVPAGRQASSTPVASPARQLQKRAASAMNARPASDSWEEF